MKIVSTTLPITILKNRIWQETIIDIELRGPQAGRELGFKNLEDSHIPEVQLYNEIKQFYRTFQTEATEERLNKLEQIANLIEEGIHDDITMDVMGSTNMGLCENTSDIDFVVYLRCDPDFEGDINSCINTKTPGKS